MKKRDALLPVVAVHGIGVGTDGTRAGFSKSLSTLVGAYGVPVRRVGEFEKPVVQIPEDAIIWEEALWERVNDPIDAATAAFLKLHFPGTPAAWLVPKILDLLGDVPLYRTTQGPKIRATVRKVIARHPGCIVVAHSLGSVIAVDVLNQAYKSGQGAGLSVSGLITLGSPLNLLKPKLPLTKAFPFRWYDCYHPSDLVHIGGNLNYEGVKPQRLDKKEPFTNAHTAYWHMRSIASIVYTMTTRA